ncbi:hypothetical protein ACPCIT_09580 [Pseudomonas siliginis]|uniref:hypothetical protein n=1 Tax=Pseudomonas siliginis TaxID=2842346 RepID=UPI003C2D79DF
MNNEVSMTLAATLAVALIAGVVSLVVSILAKDQKTSEFRQAWIDGLRNDVSQLIAHLAVVKTLSAIVRQQSQPEIQKFILSKEKDFLETAMLSSRIRLRLNPNEHKALLALVKDSDGIGRSDSLMEAHMENLAIETQEILKTEWERVKRGEPSFVLLKLISRCAVIIMGVAVAAATVALALEHWNIPTIWR